CSSQVFTPFASGHTALAEGAGLASPEKWTGTNSVSCSPVLRGPAFTGTDFAATLLLALTKSSTSPGATGRSYWFETRAVSHTCPASVLGSVRCHTMGPTIRTPSTAGLPADGTN